MSETNLPTVMPTTNRPQNANAAIDVDTSRLDGVAKVTGRARYSRDYYLPNGLFAAFIRSPYGKATLIEADESAAKSVPGVVEVVLDDRKEAKYQGQTVGYVLADSPNAMRRGLRALKAKWEYETRPGSCLEEVEKIRPAMENDSASATFDKADHILEAEYSTPIQTHVCLETHGSVADHRGESATVYTSTQGTYAARDGLSGAIGLKESEFELVCEYIGGGFGSKLNGAGKEGAQAARLSARHKRPVYLFCNRKEEHLDTGNRPSSHVSVKLAIKGDGTILGGQIHSWGGAGVGGRGGGTSMPSGRYRFGTRGNLERTHEDVAFAGGAPRPMRAPGAPQGAFVEELILDEVASMCDLDPIELRLKIGSNSEDRGDMMREAARLIGWDRRVKTGSQKGVIRRGFGIAQCSWHQSPATADVEVVINRDGSVQAKSGSQDIGTGTRTAVGIGAAEGLGVPLAAITSMVGRSSYPIGPNSGGSVTLANVYPASFRAGEDARDKFLAFLGSSLGVEAGLLSIKGGEVFNDGKKILSWSDACAKIGDAIVGRGHNDQRTRRADEGDGHSSGVQAVEVEVDTSTGVVRAKRVVAIQACGRAVFRKGAESQIMGGVIQGLSFALFESKIMDRSTGTMVNPNMEQYKILGPDDMPHIVPVLWTKDQTSPRSLAEPPVVPTAGALACAVFNAIGTPVRSLPITPDKVLAALRGGAQ